MRQECTGACTWSTLEDCASRASSDSDGGNFPLVGGTITDYTTCTSGGDACAVFLVDDSCSGTNLNERRASGSTYTTTNWNCNTFAGLAYCDSNQRYRGDAWGCSGSPATCNDGAVGDSFIGSDPDGDGVDTECGDGAPCSTVDGVCITGVGGKCVTWTGGGPETICDDGLDNDCDGLSDCSDPDCDPAVYPNCCISAPDLTFGSWPPPATNPHQDAGIDFGGDLFDSGGACPGSPCVDPDNNTVLTQVPLPSGSCCGDDPGEYFNDVDAPASYGRECTDEATDCVFQSSGDAINSDEGNQDYWCYESDWHECLNTGDIGPVPGGGQATCVGDASGVIWWPTGPGAPSLPAEHYWSCTDGIDNNANSLIDADDPGCDGNITGVIEDNNGNLIDSALVEIWDDGGVRQFTLSLTNGSYKTPNVPYGTYTVVIDHPDFAPVVSNNILIGDGLELDLNFVLVSAVACEPDCTLAGDEIIHSSCWNVNNCSFYDAIAAASCDLAKVGWIREYSATHVVECPSGTPIPKVQIAPSVTCKDQPETVVQLPSIVRYKGEVVNMVVVTCG